MVVEGLGWGEGFPVCRWWGVKGWGVESREAGQVVGWQGCGINLLPDLQEEMNRAFYPRKMPMGFLATKMAGIVFNKIHEYHFQYISRLVVY